eukprot:15456410-Alexandrium_andersonii.AAC.1
MKTRQFENNMACRQEPQTRDKMKTRQFDRLWDSLPESVQNMFNEAILPSQTCRVASKQALAEKSARQDARNDARN